MLKRRGNLRENYPLSSLKNGRLNGEQIISEEWVKESTSSKLTADQFRPHHAYGYQWWRFPDDFFENDYQYRCPETNDIFIDFGLGGQLIFVVPHLDMVVVLTGWDFKSPQENTLFLSCLAAVRDTQTGSN